MADSLLDMAERLLDMADRLWDLLPVVKANIDHPDFEGAYSIKKVLPALVPGLTYEGRTIADGQDAKVSRDEAIRLRQGPEKTAILDDAGAYGELDTLAMVVILRVLRRLASG
jgi:hypothetical protein